MREPSKKQDIHSNLHTSILPPGTVHAVPKRFFCLKLFLSDAAERNLGSTDCQPLEEQLKIYQ